MRKKWRFLDTASRLFSQTQDMLHLWVMTTKISVGNHDSAEPRYISSLDESFILHWSWG